MSGTIINPHVLAPDVGGSSVTVGLPGSTQSASRSVTDPSNANAGWRFNADGTVDRRQGSWSYNHDWCDPTGGTPGDDFEIRCTVDSGSTPTGSSTGSWLSLASTCSWSLSQTSVGSKTASLTIEIRDVATETLQDSQTYAISAEVSSGGGTATETDPTNPTY